jgi:hypothetical protein
MSEKVLSFSPRITRFLHLLTIRGKEHLVRHPEHHAPTFTYINGFRQNYISNPNVPACSGVRKDCVTHGTCNHPRP